MKNHLKEKIAAGEKALGIFYELGGSAVAESLALGGFDFLIIDTEHGPYDVESAREAILAVEKYDIAPLVRVKDATRPSILKMLDVGAKGLIVPAIETVEEVEKLVEYAKYYPVGRRGFAPTRAGRWGYGEKSQTTAEYFEEHNQGTLLFPQCETKGALENIDAIASMEGVDGIFIGPYDLSVALGKPADMENPELVDAIAHVLSVCKQHGKLTMIYAGTAQATRKLFDDGFDSVAGGMDAILLIEAARQLVAEVRESK